jgi:type IV secretion system protein VirB3
VFKSVFALLPSLLFHGIGYAAHLRDPHVMALWMTRLRRTPRVRNRRLWGANAYRP